MSGNKLTSRKGWWYLSGGNPAHIPGIYLDRKLVQTWPVYIKPTPERVGNIIRLLETRRDAGMGAMSHAEVEAELVEARLLAPRNKV